MEADGRQGETERWTRLQCLDFLFMPSKVLLFVKALVPPEELFNNIW